MLPSDGAASIEAEARTFLYDAGAVGAPLARVIAVEAPIELVVGGAPFVVMMATPRDLEDFAYGFLLSEGVVDRPDDIRALEIGEAREGWRIAATLTGDKLKAHLARKRAIGGRTGCGLCGVEDLSQLPSPNRPIGRAAPIEPAAIGSALAELETRQPLNALTRAVHAAAWSARDGRIVLVREDVGRHNALDKAIGALWRAGVGADSGFFVITSRCSFEMVAKAAVFGASTLVSVSAPTSLALSRARDYGVSVVAVARADKALSFEGAERRERRIGVMTTGKFDKLVRMANQIGDFYAAMPEDEATDSVAHHLRRFWTRKMIRELLAFAEGERGGLNPTAAHAVEALRRSTQV